VNACQACAKGLVKICQIPLKIQMEANHTCPPITSSRLFMLTIHPLLRKEVLVNNPWVKSCVWTFLQNNGYFCFLQDDDLDISPIEIDEALIIEDDDISNDEDEEHEVHAETSSFELK
jgi:hypothetical protein